MKKFKNAIDKINQCVEYVTIVLIAVMVIVVFLQVIFRFIIERSLAWSEEMARYLLIWVTFLGASIGMKRKSHIGVEVVVNLFSERIQVFIRIITNMIMMVFLVAVIIWSQRLLAIVSQQRSPAMEISMAIPYTAIVVSSALMALYILYNILLDIIEIRNKKKGLQ
ncbi:MAG: TRAP transporter small permease [Peptostreptococcales bacterium]